MPTPVYNPWERREERPSMRYPRYIRPYPRRPRKMIRRLKWGGVVRQLLRQPRPRRHAKRRGTGYDPDSYLEARAAQDVEGSLEERIFYKALVDHGFIPGVDFVFQSSEFGGRAELGGLLADFVFPVPRLVVQVMSQYWHSTPEVEARDVTQQALLEMLGYTVMFLWEGVIRDEAALERWIDNNLLHLWGTSSYPLASGSSEAPFTQMLFGGTMNEYFQLLQRVQNLEKLISDINADERLSRIEEAIFSGRGGPELRITSANIAQTLRSANYVEGTSGWRLDRSGNAEFNDVVVRGTIYASSGRIGGWTIGSTKLVGGDAELNSAGKLILGSGNNVCVIDATDATYRLWAGNATASSAPFRVGKDGSAYVQSLTVTGESKSSNYSFGLRGWRITGDGDAEFNSAIIRGELRAAVFRLGTIQAAGGVLAVAPSAALASDISATQTSFDLTEVPFSVNDFIRLQDYIDGAVRSETMRITAISGNTVTVTRAVSGTAYAWTKGTAVVRWMDRIVLDASDGAHTPHISVIDQYGSGINDYALRVRIGELQGSYGYTSSAYGMAAGSETGIWIGVDATNGFRIMQGSTRKARWDTSGNITIGEVAPGRNNVYITPGGVYIRNNTVNRITLDASGVLTLNDTAGNAVFTFNTSGAAELTRRITLPGTSSAIAIGATPPTGPSSGTGIWIDRTGIYGLQNNTQRVKFDATTGEIVAGNITLSNSVIRINMPADTQTNHISLRYGGTEYGGLFGYRFSQFNSVFIGLTLSSSPRTSGVLLHIDPDYGAASLMARYGSRSASFDAYAYYDEAYLKMYAERELIFGNVYVLPITGVAVGEIYARGDNRGLAARVYEPYGTPTDHFRSGYIPSGYSWTTLMDHGGTPPYVNYGVANDYMAVGGAANTNYLLGKYGPTSLSACQGKHFVVRVLPGDVSAGVTILYNCSGTWRYVTCKVYRASDYTIIYHLQHNLGGSDVPIATNYFWDTTQPVIIRLLHHTDNYVYSYVVNEAGWTQNLARTSVAVPTILNSFWGMGFYGSGQYAYVDWFLTNI